MLGLLILLFLIAVWYALTRVGAHIVFRPQKKRWPLKLPFQNIAFPAPDGKMITGVYLPAKNDFPTLLFFHGRGGNVSHFEAFAQAYAPLGYGVMLFDYRGFGLSAGKPSQKTVFEDALCAVRYALKGLKISPKDIVLFGHSLGNAPALYASAELGKLPFKALVLQSPFLSTPDMAVCLRTHAYSPASRWYRLAALLVTPFLYFNRFDNVKSAKKLPKNLPVLVCMSQADKTIPWRQSAKLADFIGREKRFLSPVGGHDEFAWAQTAVAQFLQKL
ncbi:alpha/beta hydrolase [Candidatus Avelusimicrobium stercoris]|uniref:alpha/beta hydrolase n=1 Tax=Candidatus Avelusimicrobium stercoris TaxID=1947924 RepID=UPI003D10119F